MGSAPPRDSGRVSVACQRHRKWRVHEGMAAMWPTGGRRARTGTRALVHRAMRRKLCRDGGRPQTHLPQSGPAAAAPGVLPRRAVSEHHPRRLGPGNHPVGGVDAGTRARARAGGGAVRAQRPTHLPFPGRRAALRHRAASGGGDGRSARRSRRATRRLHLGRVAACGRPRCGGVCAPPTSGGSGTRTRRCG